MDTTLADLLCGRISCFRGVQGTLPAHRIYQTKTETKNINYSITEQYNKYYNDVTEKGKRDLVKE